MENPTVNWGSLSLCCVVLTVCFQNKNDFSAHQTYKIKYTPPKTSNNKSAFYVFCKLYILSDLVEGSTETMLALIMQIQTRQTGYFEWQFPAVLERLKHKHDAQ